MSASAMNAPTYGGTTQMQNFDTFLQGIGIVNDAKGYLENAKSAVSDCYARLDSRLKVGQYPNWINNLTNRITEYIDSVNDLYNDMEAVYEVCYSYEYGDSVNVPVLGAYGTATDGGVGSGSASETGAYTTDGEQAAVSFWTDFFDDNLLGKFISAVGATVANVAVSLVQGLVSFVESLVDAIVVLTAHLAGVFSDSLQQSMVGFATIDMAGSARSWFADTEFGQWMEDDSVIAGTWVDEGIVSAGKWFGVTLAGAAITYFTAGAGTVPFLSAIMTSTGATVAMGAVSGFGTYADDALQGGATLGAATGLGILGAGFGALEAYGISESIQVATSLAKPSSWLGKIFGKDDVLEGISKIANKQNKVSSWFYQKSTKNAADFVNIFSKKSAAKAGSAGSRHAGNQAVKEATEEALEQAGRKAIREGAENKVSSQLDDVVKKSVSDAVNTFNSTADEGIKKVAQSVDVDYVEKTRLIEGLEEAAKNKKIGILRGQNVEGTLDDLEGLAKKEVKHSIDEALKGLGSDATKDNVRETTIKTLKGIIDDESVVNGVVNNVKSTTQGLIRNGGTDVLKYAPDSVKGKVVDTLKDVAKDAIVKETTESLGSQYVDDFVKKGIGENLENLTEAQLKQETRRVLDDKAMDIAKTVLKSGEFADDVVEDNAREMVNGAVNRAIEQKASSLGRELTESEIGDTTIDALKNYVKKDVVEETVQTNLDDVVRDVIDAKKNELGRELTVEETRDLVRKELGDTVKDNVDRATRSQFEHTITEAGEKAAKEATEERLREAGKQEIRREAEEEFIKDTKSKIASRDEIYEAGEKAIKEKAEREIMDRFTGGNANAVKEVAESAGLEAVEKTSKKDILEAGREAIRAAARKDAAGTADAAINLAAEAGEVVIEDGVKSGVVSKIGDFVKGAAGGTVKTAGAFVGFSALDAAANIIPKTVLDAATATGAQVTTPGGMQQAPTVQVPQTNTQQTPTTQPSQPSQPSQNSGSTETQPSNTQTTPPSQSNTQSSQSSSSQGSSTSTQTSTKPSQTTSSSQTSSSGSSSSKDQSQTTQQPESSQGSQQTPDTETVPSPEEEKIPEEKPETEVESEETTEDVKPEDEVLETKPEEVPEEESDTVKEPISSAAGWDRYQEELTDRIDEMYENDAEALAEQLKEYNYSDEVVEKLMSDKELVKEAVLKAEQGDRIEQLLEIRESYIDNPEAIIEKLEEYGYTDSEIEIIMKDDKLVYEAYVSADLKNDFGIESENFDRVLEINDLYYNDPEELKGLLKEYGFSNRQIETLMEDRELLQESILAYEEKKRFEESLKAPSVGDGLSPENPTVTGPSVVVNDDGTTSYYEGSETPIVGTLEELLARPVTPPAGAGSDSSVGTIPDTSVTQPIVPDTEQGGSDDTIDSGSSSMGVDENGNIIFS